MVNPLLIQGIHTLSIGALTMFQEQYPEIYDVLSRSKRPGNDWNFYMTAAGVSLAIMNATLQGEAKERAILETASIDKQIPDAIQDLLHFIETYAGVAIDLRGKVGVWILWNIGNQCPSHKESCRLAPALGMYLEKIIEDFIENPKR